MRAFAIASTIAASASVALAGNAVVQNNCDHDVYVWQVGDQLGKLNTVKAGDSWSAPYQTRSAGGCSVKIAKQDNIWGGISVTQFEYTYTPQNKDGGLWYDISNIDGDPFKDVHTEIVPQLSNGVSNTTTCNTVTCPPGGQCKNAYNVPDDNFATHACPSETDLTFHVCKSGSNSGSSNSGSAAPASSPAPVASPVQSSTPVAAASSPATTVAPVHAQAAATSAAPSPAPPAPETTIVTVAVPASTPTPVAHVPGPNAYALSWSVGDKYIREGQIHKREAHENHAERHARIARMHHARSQA